MLQHCVEVLLVLLPLLALCLQLLLLLQLLGDACLSQPLTLSALVRLDVDGCLQRGVLAVTPDNLTGMVGELLWVGLPFMIGFLIMAY